MVMCVQNVRIGVIRQTIDPATADADMMRLFEDALADLSGAGCLSFFFLANIPPDYSPLFPCLPNLLTSAVLLSSCLMQPLVAC